MQEVYYVYKLRHNPEFRIIADRGRRLTDIEVDVSIAHAENVPLGSVRWHKVVVNPLDELQRPGQPDKMQDNLPLSRRKGSQARYRSYKLHGRVKGGARDCVDRRKNMRADLEKTINAPAMMSHAASRLRWENILADTGAIA